MGRYEVIGDSWEIYNKGRRCRGGKKSCEVFDFKDEVESRHRCATCLAKTVLGIHGGHHHAYASGSGYRTVGGGGHVYGYTTGGVGQDWYGGSVGGEEGERRLRYSSDASVASFA